MEVAVTFALLEILDNPRQDVPLISVLRSPLFRLLRRTVSPSCARKTPGGDFTMHSPRTGARTPRFLALLRELRETRGRSRSPSWSRRSMSAAISRRCSARCGEEPHAGKIFVRSSRWRRNLSAAAGGGSSPLSGICARSWNPASRPCRRPRTPRRACAL